MALAEPQVELRNWLDRLAIQDLIYRYCDAITRADWKQCEALLAPDLIWEVPALGLRHDSAAAFLEMLAGTSTSEVLVQMPHAPVITLIGPEKAQATTTIYDFSRRMVDNADREPAVSRRLAEETSQETYGVYFDDLARIDGEWKFTHRRYALIYTSTGCVKGDVVTPRSGLLRTE